MRSRFLLSLLFIVLATASLKAQVLGSRLISLVNFEMISSFSPTDSTTYHYQGLKNSDMKKGLINYDSALFYAYNSSAYHKYRLSTKSYGPADSISLFYQYDWNDTINNWDPASYSVNSNFDITSHLVQNRIIMTAGVPNTYMYTYDGSNNLLEILRLGPSGFDSLGKSIYTYDGSNNMLSVTYQTWAPTPSPGFRNFQSVIHAYNSLNEDTLKVYRTWDPGLGVWRKESITNTYYDPSKKVISNYYTTFIPSVGFITTSRDTMMYDTANNLVNITTQAYDTMTHVFNNYKQTTWTYDKPWNNPLVRTTFSWSGGVWVSLPGQDEKSIYHYEEYTNAIHNVNNAIGKFELFPVPAQNFVTVRLKWSEPQAFTIAIYDMQGRLMQQTGETATTNYQRTLSISDLPAGTYMMEVKGNSAAVAQQFTVSK